MHLQLLSGIYHFRVGIPKAYQFAFAGRTEIKRSLKTRHKRTAQVRANQIHISYMKKIEDTNVLYDFTALLVDGTQITVTNPDPEKEVELGVKAMKALQTTQVASLDLPELAKQHLANTEVVKRTQTEKIRAIEMYLTLHKEINHHCANAFSDILKTLPPRFKYKTKEDLQKLSKESHKKTLGWKSHNKYISNMSSWNSWLVKRGLIDKNYFTLLMMKRTKAAHLERDPLDQDEVTLLLKESSKLTGYKYWLPRLGLYTGCRLRELSQLYTKNVILLEGTLCLSIKATEPDQHLKNISSERIIPIHPAIAEEFNEYIKRSSNVRVFPGLTYTSANGFGGMASKWYGRFRRKIGLQKDFHSLRHTFASSLSDARVVDSIISDLMGHSKPGMTHIYTGRKSVEILLEAVSLLKFN